MGRKDLVSHRYGRFSSGAGRICLRSNERSRNISIWNKSFRNMNGVKTVHVKCGKTQGKIELQARNKETEARDGQYANLSSSGGSDPKHFQKHGFDRANFSSHRGFSSESLEIWYKGHEFYFPPKKFGFIGSNGFIG
jgi:hypothetical protein